MEAVVVADMVDRDLQDCTAAVGMAVPDHVVVGMVAVGIAVLNHAVAVGIADTVAVGIVVLNHAVAVVADMVVVAGMVAVDTAVVGTVVADTVAVIADMAVVGWVAVPFVVQILVAQAQPLHPQEHLHLQGYSQHPQGY